MIGTIVYISYIIYAVSLFGTVRSYIEKDIAPGCLLIFFANMPGREYCDIHTVRLFKEQS